ncbi:hypothetical protein M407DRAFT_29046 [Tulasnella calospora MUT 4182]|uniref:Protein kinase domain-containing protein n=1 Tax=Tulasnella calospora MUT 4182 TaxID=1051891 RepID=A0A0C3KIQ8_9AGAM|nr:hypothetical protein M407DRAFT_29046 [Tulasnella calospora MUT 4182]
MQGFTSNSEPLQGAGSWNLSPCHAPLLEENAGAASDVSVGQGTSTDAAAEIIPQKPSAVGPPSPSCVLTINDIPQRERLDYLASFRTSLEAISFNSSKSHRGGGKAKVMPATVRGAAGNEETVAVKKLNYHEGMEIHKFSNEFVNEVEILAGLSHDNVVRLIGFVEQLEQGEAWLILCWHPNGNVGEFLAKGEWEIPERISLIKDTFEGLTYLHSRKPPICHGDLKSLNILVSSSYRAIITDFGSARLLNKLAERVVTEDLDLTTRWDSATEEVKIDVGATGDQLTLTGPSWSLRWASPEVLFGATPNLPSDIWSAGWICWEIMTNRVPFPELNSEGVITLTVIKGKVPSTREDAQLSQINGLCSLMTDCWKFNPKERPGIAQCRNEIVWMPSTPPSGVKALSPELLLQMGNLNLSQGRYEKAGSLFQQALAAARAAGGSNEIAKTLFRLGTTYTVQAKFPEAEDSFVQAQEIYSRTGDDQGRANVLQGLGNLYSLQSKASEAEESFIQAQQIYTRIGDDQGRANGLRGLGDLYYSQTKYSEAEKSLIQAQQIYTRTGDGQGQANAFKGLGDLYCSQTKYLEAEEAFVQSQQICTRLGNDHGRANALQARGKLYYLQNKYPEAEDSFVQAQQIYTHIGNDQGRASALQTLGDLYCIQTKYSDAEKSLIQAQQIFTRIGDDQGRANTFRGLGNLYSAQTKYSEAQESFLQAQQIFIRTGDDQGRANVLQGLGDVYYSQGKYCEAEESLTQAQQIYTRTSDAQGQANALQALGDLYRSQSKYSEAEKSLIQAQEISTRIGDNQGRANAFRGLGTLYCLQTKYCESEESLIQAQQIYTRLGEDWGRAETLRKLGHLHTTQSRYVKAAAFYAEARDLFARIGRLDDQEDASRWLEAVSQE